MTVRFNSYAYVTYTTPLPKIFHTTPLCLVRINTCIISAERPTHEDDRYYWSHCERCEISYTFGANMLLCYLGPLADNPYASRQPIIKYFANKNSRWRVFDRLLNTYVFFVSSTNNNRIRAENVYRGFFFFLRTVPQFPRQTCMSCTRACSITHNKRLIEWSVMRVTYTDVLSGLTRRLIVRENVRSARTRIVRVHRCRRER